jgi:hypothetical protein
MSITDVKSLCCHILPHCNQSLIQSIGIVINCGDMGYKIAHLEIICAYVCVCV